MVDLEIMYDENSVICVFIRNYNNNLYGPRVCNGLPQGPNLYS